MGGWASEIELKAMIGASAKELKRLMDRLEYRKWMCIFWFRRKSNHRLGLEFWQSKSLHKTNEYLHRAV